jgi:alanine dehydrogenase
LYLRKENTIVKDHTESGRGNLSRRNFIQSAGIGAGAAAITLLTSRDTKAISPDQVPEWNYEADVVIMGTGFAGQVSSIVAHDGGASVLMIEKAPEKHQGGNSKVCGRDGVLQRLSSMMHFCT